MQRPVRDGALKSGARHWAPLARFIETEARIGAWAEGRTATLELYELARFGIKQGWACIGGVPLFTGFMYAAIGCVCRRMVPAARKGYARCRNGG